MNPCQKIKREIMLLAVETFKNSPYFSRNKDEQDFVKLVESGITDETVEQQYDKFVEMELHWDFENEFREGTVETKLPCEYSRHYEAKAVARKMVDGTWLGWTFYYGGGKHGNPEEVEWMEDAYELEATEKVVVVQDFKKI